ncbi:MAG: hypothetical protein RLZZ203_99 [Cyanobacteriota bacterium]|jgi:hypothetical protein
MSNLAVSGWEYLVNAPDGFWCVQLRSKEAGELSSRGERLGQNLYPAPAERTLDFNCSIIASKLEKDNDGS